MEPTWARDGIELYLGDCLEVLPTLAAGSADAVVTDPPYGVGIACWDGDLPPQAALTACLRVAIGTVLWFGAASKVLDFARYAPPPERMMIWAPSFTLAKCSKGRAFYRFHPIWVWRHPKSQKSIGTDVLRHRCDGRNWWNHPGTKPLDLMADCVGFTNATSVCDPFMGSGTTGVACVQTGRRFIGIEIDPGYFEIAVKRIEKALAEKAQELQFAEVSA